MWRSRALAARRACELSRLAGARAGAGRLKLHSVSKTTNSPEVHHPFHSHFLTPKTLFPLNPRFFSHDSTDPIPDFIPEQSPHTDPVVSKEADASSADNDGVFVENNSSFNVSEECKQELASPAPFQLTVDENDESVVVEKDEIQKLDLEKLESVRSLLLSSGGSVSGESIDSRLDDMDLILNEDFVLKVLETPLIPKESLVLFSKWAASPKNPNGFSFASTTSLDALVHAICCSGELTRNSMFGLWDIVKEVGEKENGVVTTKILNQLISCFFRLGKFAGYQVFSHFEKFLCVPDSDSYYYTLEALCRRSILDLVGPVCNKMLNDGKLPEQPDRIGDMICFLCKKGMVKDAHSVYLSVKAKEKYPPQSSVNVLIASLCDRGEEDVKYVYLALEMLEDFSAGEERKYAIKPFTSVIQGLCRIKDFEGAKVLLFKMIDAGPPPGNAVFNLIIHSLSKAGDLEEAKKIMKVMESRGLKPDLYTYSVIMSGYAKGGEMEEAAKVLAEAKKNHSKLTPVIYHTIIRGYCKIEKFDKAVKLLAEMKKYGVNPTTDEYNKLIQSLCLKATDWETAAKLVKEMKNNGLRLDGSTVGLVRAVKELEEEGLEAKEADHEA